MTQEQIKGMLNGIINNGEKWECRPIIKANNAFDLEEKQNRYNFKYEPYKLGDEIHADWEYRKVKNWYEDYLKLFPKSGQKETCRIVCKEVTKKILEEVKKSNNILGSIVYKDVEDIIKDLGIEL